MKIVFCVLSFIILMGCSGEGASQAIASQVITAEGKSSEKAQQKEASMLGLFGKKPAEQYVISSPLEGVLIKDGEPLANTTIARYLEWTGLEGEIVDQFITDEQGKFTIPVHKETLTLGKLTQFVAKALLVVEFEGEEIEIWLVAKFDGELYSDLTGPLNDLVCDINQDTLDLNMPHSIIATKCRWVGMPMFKS